MLSPLAIFAFLPSQNATLLPYRNPELPIESRVEDLLKRMTLE